MEMNSPELMTRSVAWRPVLSANSRLMPLTTTWA